MTDTPAQLVAAFEARARRIETPCGDGSMIWRIWGDDAAPPLVLLHGGSGSWKHWMRNIEHFARTRRVIAADMPGYGDSADAPAPVSFASLGEIMGSGLDRVIGSDTVYDMLGFSLGSFMAPFVIKASRARARSLMLVHGHLVGKMQYNPQERLRRWRGLEGAERDAVLRHNLGALMLAHPESADDLTLHVYRADLDLSRLRVQGFIDTLDTSVLKSLDTKLFVVTGDLDPTASPDVPAQHARLREMRPDIVSHIIPNAGHWVMWEDVSAFNAVADACLSEAGSARI